MNPYTLPVYQQKEKILSALADNQVIIVESPTGSGKTTQIPLILHEAGYTGKGVVGVTQPRRIAAVSVSEFIAAQIHTAIPGVVGYKMRFEDKTDASTVIKIMTDGILLQEMKGDRDLSRYSTIIVDEAHERSLNIDFILGLLKWVLPRRPEFRVIVSSATINVEVFSEYFDGCPVVSIDAPMFPVELVYSPPERENESEAVLDKIVETVSKIMRSGKTGDILIFLQGELAIKDCVTAVRALDRGDTLEVLPLYGRLSREEQQRVFQEFPGRRKVIVSTNITETSVTIDGVAFVIDSGLAKINFYNPKTFTESLVETPVSKASCNQRRGRAGRTAPGICHRLYSHKDYESRPMYTMEEIHRTDLSEVVLRMAELGIVDFHAFDFLSPPSKEGISGAIETLRLLDALDEENTLTETGHMMCLFPILPKHSRAIVEAIRKYPDVLEDVIVAATFLSVNSPFLLPAGEELEARKAHHSFRDPMGDFASYLRIYDAFVLSKDRTRFADRYYLDLRIMNEIENITRQLEEIVSNLGIPIGTGGSVEDYICAVARGLIQFVCVRTGKGSYKSLTADRIGIHPGSLMFRENPQYIVAGEIVRTSRMYARSVSPLKKQLLARISPVLHESFVQGIPYEKEKEEEREAKKRDFTNQIKIGGAVFPIRVLKGGKKTVYMEWASLEPLLKNLPPGGFPGAKNLRGAILWDGREIMSGMRFSSVVSLAQHIHPERGVWEEWPSKRTFRFSTEARELAGHLHRLLTLCPMKESSKRLGFLTLFTDGKGAYWFRSEKSLNTARLESLASLESLADEEGEGLDREERDRIAKLYRELDTAIGRES